jgi:hypothetical protein
MRRPRLRSTLAALCLALAATALGFCVPKASADDPFPNQGIATLSSDHFMVHYSRDDHSETCPTQYISQETAGDILGWAERAYSYYTSWGYTTPILDAGDGDSLLDISVDEFDKVAPSCISYGNIDPSIPVEPDGTLKRWVALVNPEPPLGAGIIHMDATDSRAIKVHIVAQEVFHLFSRAMSVTADPWLHAGTAEWAAVRVEGATGGTDSNPDRTADCVGAECGDTEYARNGYPGWILFEYLAERYGDGAVKAVWDHAAANPGVPGTTDLAAVLPAGTTLASFFNDYANARLTGNFTLPALAGSLPTTARTIDVSETSAPVPSNYIAVNHLAVRYVALKHGTSNGPCYEASLTLNVTIPAGVESKPTYYANSLGAVAEPLSISGSTGSITVPWNTCADSPDGYLSLPNGTLGMDGREFVVSGSVSVDATKPASASAPPPVNVIGPVVPVPTSDPAPTLKVYAPEVLRVSSKTRLLRLAVFSSGEGKLQASLGSTSLGTASLRSGNNDVRFVIPVQLFKSLRPKSASNVLALTSLSPGGTKGSTVTRRVLVVGAKPKPKPKPKPKH